MVPLQQLLVEFLGADIPEIFIIYLFQFLIAQHPGDWEKLYHNPSHTFEVSDFIKVILNQFIILDKWKDLCVVSALFHDIDPERTPNTLPSVERTIQYLKTNPEAKVIINYLCEVFGFTPQQIYTLILATDYSDNPEERSYKWDKFCNECEIYFEEEEINTAIFLGEILAFADKAATYIQSTDVVEKRVRGLAFELRTRNDSPDPTDEEMLMGTGIFQQTQLIESRIFVCLPDKYKQKLRETVDFFTNQTLQFSQLT